MRHCLDNDDAPVSRHRADDIAPRRFYTWSPAQQSHVSTAPVAVSTQRYNTSTFPTTADPIVADFVSNWNSKFSTKIISPTVLI